MSEFAPPVKQPKHFALKCLGSFIPMLVMPILFGHMAYSDWGHKINGNKHCIYLDNPVYLNVSGGFEMGITR
jgi:hypothetical protein